MYTVTTADSIQQELAKQIIA